MSGLEIALLIFALALIIVSFFLVDKKGEENTQQNMVPVPNTKQLDVISKRAIQDMNTSANKVLEETQDQLESISNDKIMAVNEYSDQVLAKIDANHKEVVFLYQMLQDKENELKETLGRMENARINGEKQVFASSDTSDRSPRKLDIGMEDFSFDDDGSGTDAKAQAEPHGKDRLKSKDRAKQRVSFVAKDEKQEMMKNAPEKNEKTNEVIKLYKKNKSVMEICKLLNMGQGEVKLIIELYCK